MNFMAQLSPQNHFLDFHHFLCHAQSTYQDLKNHAHLPSLLPHDKFSSPFQNQYAQLSAKFDEMLQKTQLDFQDHKIALEDQQQLIEHLLINLPTQTHNSLVILLSKLLLHSETIYHKWINDEVATLKDQLDLVILKNCQLQAQIQQLYDKSDSLNDQLIDEQNKRFQLENYCRSVEKELSLLKQQHQETVHSNNQLIASMEDLDGQVQASKQSQRITSRQELICQEQLKYEKSRATSLEQSNRQMAQKITVFQLQLRQLKKKNIQMAQTIASSQLQLDQLKKDQLTYIEEIKHLTELIENQNYQLDFYKGKDLRQTPSAILQSFDKLNRYEDLLESYHKSSRRGSLKSFDLSHQKSMGKLTIFQPHQHTEMPSLSDEKMFGKISNPDLQIQSFEYVQQMCHSKLNPNGIDLPQLSQLTFRPVADRKIASSQQLNVKEDWETKNQQHVNFISVQDNGQETSRFQVENIEGNLMMQNGQIFIEPLKISGKKHRRQRSQTITEGSSALVTKRLNYEEITEKREDAMKDQKKDEEQADKKSQAGYSESKNTVYSVNEVKARTLQKILEQEHNQMETKSELKRHLLGYQSRANLGLNYEIRRSPRQNMDNRSEANTVNKALIKKNMRVQKEMEEMRERLQKAEGKVQSCEQVIEELEGEVGFYRQQLSKEMERGIRLKSQIESYRADVENLEQFKLEQEALQDEQLRMIGGKNQLVQRLSVEMVNLKQQIQEMEAEKQTERRAFEERLAKVKQYCRKFIEQKHQQQIYEIQHCYQQELTQLKQRIETLSAKPVQMDFFTQTIAQNLQNLLLISKIFQYQIDTSSFNQSIFTQTPLHNHFQIYESASQTVHPTQILPKITYRNHSISPAYNYCLSYEQFHRPNHNLFIFNTVTQMHQPSHHQHLSFSHPISLSVQSQINKSSTSTSNQHKHFNITNTIKLQVHKVQGLKSPLLDKKQLLSTPSSFNTFQTRKLSPPSHKQERQNFSHSDSRTSPETNQYEYELIHRHEPDQIDQDPDQTFMTVSFVRDLSSIDHLSEGQDSFFTCIPFSSSQSFGSQRVVNCSSMAILEQDIFVIKKESHLESDALDSLQTSPVIDTFPQDHAFNQCQKVQHHSFGTKQIVQSLQNAQKIPTKIIPSIMHYNQSCEGKQPQVRQIIAHDINDGYFQIKFSKQNQTSEQITLYSQIFEQHLYPYFKKHTAFQFLSAPLPSDQTPNHQQMYILHTEKPSLSRHLNNFNSVQKKPKLKQRFLMYKKLFLNIQTQQKLEIPTSQMLKFFSDQTKIILGNFEILVTNKNELKISRKYKKCSYFGDIQDGTWEIVKVQEIMFEIPNSKK